MPKGTARLNHPKDKVDSDLAQDIGIPDFLAPKYGPVIWALTLFLLVKVGASQYGPLLAYHTESENNCSRLGAYAKVPWLRL